MKFLNAIATAIIRGLIYVNVWLVFRPKVYFADGSKKKKRLPQPCILVCNHKTHVDGGIVGTIFFREKIRSLAAKDRFEQSKLLGWFMRRVECIPIDRQGLDTNWIHESLQLLMHNKANISIYPEGLRSHTEEILPFHSGVTTLAFMARVPIVMIYLHGPYEPFRKRLNIMVSEPFNIEIPATGITADFVDQETQNLHDKMLKLQKQLKDTISKL